MKKSAVEETIGAKIPVDEMVVDPEYQGSVNEALVDKIVAGWKDSAAGAVILNLRDDNTYAVLDGQHRVLAAKKVGVTELNSLVFIGKTRQEEAALFVQLNTKHNVRPFDKFRANLLAGKTEEKNIKTICSELGLELSNAPNKNNNVRCIVALKAVYTNFGPSHLKLVLGLLQATFGEYPDRFRALSDEAVIGTAQFFYRYPKADAARLMKKLKAYSPTTIQGIGAGRTDPGQSKWMGWGKAITGIYNSGFRITHDGYLPMERWDRAVYTPAGKLAVAENARKGNIAKSRGLETRFGSPVRELKIAAKESLKRG